MEISGKTHLLVPQANTLATDDAYGTGASESSASHADKDIVNLSANANEIREMVHKVNHLPDVREDKVAELKRRIASGTYRIMNERVASRLIGEAMQNNAVLNHIDSHDD